MPFVLAGQDDGPATVCIDAAGTSHEIQVSVDQLRQEPAISHNESPGLVQNGTFVKVGWPNSACLILADAKDDFVQVAQDYAWLNPHATITIDWDGHEFEHNEFLDETDLARLEIAHTRENVQVEATAPEWAKWRPSDPTCPHWYDRARLERLIRAQAAKDADSGRDRTVREFLGKFRGLRRPTKQREVLNTAGLSRTNLSQLADDETGTLDRESIGQLLAAMHQHTKSVKPQNLGVLGQDHVTRRLKAEGCEAETIQYRKKAGEINGLPWLVEVGFGVYAEALEGDADECERKLVTGVNWSPAIGDSCFRKLDNGYTLDSLLSEQESNWLEQRLLWFI
jgi:hypothetical protein